MTATTTNQRRKKRMQQKNMQQKRPTVTIETRMHVACVPRGVLKHILPVLESTSIRSRWTRENGFEQQNEQARLYGANDDHVAFPAGLVDRVRQTLREAGYRVQVQPRTRWTQLGRANKSLINPSKLPSYQRDMLQAIKRKPRGQILVYNQAEAREMLDTLVKYYPHESILIMAKNNETAESTASRLRTSTGRNVTQGTEPENRRGPKIHVDSLSSFAGWDVMTWTMAIVVDLESARSETALDLLLCMEETLRFAILPKNSRNDRRDALLLEAFYGPVVFCLDDQAACDTKVTVQYLPPPAYPATERTDPLERKRIHIWHNDQRNQMIANVAMAAGARDRRALECMGIDVGKVLDERASGGRPRIAIIVEGLEHGRALQKLLPGWPLLDVSGVDETDQLPVLMYEGEEQGIVTRTRANHAGVYADLVLRVEGTGAGWNADLGPYPFISGREMLVVDFRDDFDEQAKKDTLRRVLSYREQGWNVIDPVEDKPHKNTRARTRAMKYQPASR